MHKFFDLQLCLILSWLSIMRNALSELSQEYIYNEARSSFPWAHVLCLNLSVSHLFLSILVNPKPIPFFCNDFLCMWGWRFFSREAFLINLCVCFLSLFFLSKREKNERTLFPSQPNITFPMSFWSEIWGLLPAWMGLWDRSGWFVNRKGEITAAAYLRGSEIND